MVDLLVKNAVLTDGRKVDIACEGGVIVGLEPGIGAEAGQVIDAGGCLVAPPFVDPHFHMDATLSLGRPRMNVSGTLLEGIALWGELKPLQSIDEIVDPVGAIIDNLGDRIHGAEPPVAIRAAG